MALVVRIARGRDASYPFRTTGAAEGPVITGQCGVGYSLSAVEKGSEPTRTRQGGSEWAYRPASNGAAIAGFPDKAIARFPTRRAHITRTTRALGDQYEKGRRHALDQRALASMSRFTNAMTRCAKGPGALDFTALLRSWEQVSRVAGPEALPDFARTICHATPRASVPAGARADTSAELPRRGGPPLAPRGELTHAQETHVAWTRADLVHSIGQHRSWRLDGRSG